MGSVGLSNVQQSPPQCNPGVYQTHDLRSDTTCWESQLSLDQNPQLLIKDHITRDKDPWAAVSPCHETHMECWFIQCPTISPLMRSGSVSNSWHMLLYHLLGIMIFVRPKAAGYLHVLVNNHIARDKDLWEAISPCYKTHGECWFIQCPTKIS